MFLTIPVSEVRIGNKFRYQRTWYFKYMDLINRTDDMIGWNDSSPEYPLILSTIGDIVVGVEYEDNN